MPLTHNALFTFFPLAAGLSGENFAAEQVRKSAE